jgi:hypothetical protein
METADGDEEEPRIMPVEQITQSILISRSQRYCWITSWQLFRA